MVANGARGFTRTEVALNDRFPGDGTDDRPRAS
jgi:hypothetical protein